MCGKEVFTVLLFTLACIWVNEIQAKCDDSNGACVVSVQDKIEDALPADAVSDALLQRAGACETNKDCKNGAKCEGKDGEEECKCQNGTSGVKCEIVDECVQNPDKCGPGNDVKCSYSGYYKEAVCDCDKYRTELDFDDFKCKDCDCGTGGRCSFVNGVKTCKCDSDYYKIKNGRCEWCSCSDGGIGCKFDEKGDKICTCKSGYTQRGDYCDDCDCGPEGNCSFNRDGKTCKCNPYFAEYDGTCQVCNCGKGLTCSFSGKGAKRCGCEPGTADKLGTCEECDCGQWSEDCKFSSGGKKLCTCRDGFASIGDSCKECECGLNGRCYFNGTEKVCDCNTNYQMLNGYCQECFCGFEGTCRFNQKGLKQCSCSKGFARKNQECVPCNCGVKDAECFFGERGRRCVCPNGFVDQSGFCKDVDECVEQPGVCPSTTKCENKMGTFACRCKDGYKMKTENSDPKIDGCEDIDECAAHPLICRSNQKMCVNIPGSFKCVCNEGYKPAKGGSCVLYSPGKDEGASGSWRTGFIVMVSLIAGAVAVIFIVVFIMRRREISLSMESIQVRNFR